MKKQASKYFIKSTAVILLYLIIIGLILWLGIMIYLVINGDRAEVETAEAYATVEQCFRRISGKNEDGSIKHEYVTVLLYMGERVSINDPNTYLYCSEHEGERVLCKVTIAHYKFPSDKDTEYNLVDVIRR